MNVVVKVAESKHLDDVLTLALETAELHTQKGKPEYYSIDQLQGFIDNPDSIFLIAEVDGNLAGFRIATFDKYVKEAYLINLVVKKEFRQNGVGQLLYKETFTELKKRGCIWAWVLVHEHNDKMVSFLEHQEFARGPKFIYFRKTFQR